jgi:hypothetical protein
METCLTDEEQIRVVRAARKIEKAAAKAEAQRRRKERAAEPQLAAEEIARHPADAELYALLLSRDVLCVALYEKLVDVDGPASGTALQAVLVCEAIFGKREL